MAEEVSEGSAAWDEVVRTPFFGVYVHELFWLAADVVRRAELVIHETPPPREEGTDYIKVDGNLHAEIYAMLASAAKIRALIEQRPRRGSQTRLQHEVLVARTRELRSLLSGIDLDAVLAVGTRHSVEHFDERIDELALEARDGKLDLPMNFPLDLAVWSRDAFDVLRGTGRPRPGIYPLRVYMASEQIFFNAGDEIDVGRLHAQCEAIAGRLRPSVPKDEDGERGGYVVVVNAGAFSQ